MRLPNSTALAQNRNKLCYTLQKKITFDMYVCVRFLFPCDMQNKNLVNEVNSHRAEAGNTLNEISLNSETSFKRCNPRVQKDQSLLEKL